MTIREDGDWRMLATACREEAELVDGAQAAELMRRAAQYELVAISEEMPLERPRMRIG